MVGLQIAPDNGQRSAQFLPIAAIAAVAETAEPVGTMGLRDDGACTEDLSALAPPVARSTDLLQATLWCRQLLCLWQGPLSGGLPRPIDVKDHVFVACAIDKLTSVSLCVHRTREQIGEKERAQGFGALEGSSSKDRARAPSGRAVSRGRTRP